MKAYVQISLNGVSESEIFKRLQNMDEVEEVHILFGEWDLIAKIDVADADLGNFVIEKIRSLPGVRLTSTMVIAK